MQMTNFFVVVGMLRGVVCQTLVTPGQSVKWLARSKTLRVVRWPVENAPVFWTAAALRRQFLSSDVNLHFSPS